jgi:hypothetical protein
MTDGIFRMAASEMDNGNAIASGTIKKHCHSDAGDRSFKRDER